MGSGTIELTLTADEIASLNTLLTGLEYLGPASEQQLDYSLFNMSGVLPYAVTHGGLTMTTAGTPGTNGSFALGGQTLLTNGETIAGTLDVTGALSVLGDLIGGAVSIAPGAVLETPYDDMTLSGSSVDFGTLFANELTLSGTMLMPGAMTLDGELALKAGARLEFTDGLTVFSTADNSFDVGLNMGVGAVIQGNGTLMVGNYSQGGVIQDGTLQAFGGDTLELDASWVTSNALLQVGGGGVMVLGPVSSLFGVFNTIPLMVDSSVTLSFMPSGTDPITGGYASTLGGTGGAFVISEPQDFAGTIIGWGAGDALIFPDIESISIYNISASSFQMAGLDVFGNTETYTIRTSIASGYSPSVVQDAEGDEEIIMRPTYATLTQGAALAATPGVAQPLTGASIDMTGSTTQALSLTLTASRGSLSSGGTYASKITLTAANLAALNAELAAVTYEGTGLSDSVIATSNTGLLVGIQGGLAIVPGGTGTISAYSGLGETEAEMISFAPTGGVSQITQGMAVGGVVVSGATDFENVLLTHGYSGTGLIVDDGGSALFGSAATVALGGNVTVGDGGGAGTLTMLAESFGVSGNVLIGGVPGAAGSTAIVAGTMSIAGTLALAPQASAGLTLDGGLLSASVLSLGTAGSFTALGAATGNFGFVTNSGTLQFGGDAVIHANSYQGNGTLDLGGVATFAVAGSFLPWSGQVGQISIGQGAVLSAGTYGDIVSTVYDAGLFSVASSMVIGNVALDGGTLAASAATLDGWLAGHGVVSAPSISIFGTVEAELGKLLLTGNVLDSSVLEIDQGAILEVGGTVGNAPVYFQGGDADLILDDTASGFSVEQMQVSDAIDLVGIAPSLVVVPTASGGAGFILNSLGGTVSQFGMVLGTTGQNISLVSDGHGGSLITLDGVLPCFARGTGILGPQGYRPVESLRPNDPVITARGERRPVRWVGWRTLDLGPDAARAARPVLIMPGAFGPGRPQKVLRLSPSHCIYMNGKLIPVTHLVNGATILRDSTAKAATYFHIELDRHDIVLADGLECESYFDDGNRATMYHELGRRSPARRLCAPVVTQGSHLAAARRALHEIAQGAGFAARYEPTLRGMAAGQTLLPEMLPAREGQVARFVFPSPVREMVLLCATSCPADTDPESDDRRDLGVCLGAARGVQLGAGWRERAVGDAGTWMGSRAMLGFARARRDISLPLAALVKRWGRVSGSKNAEPVVDAGRWGG